MLFPPRYELVFALDDQATDALILSASRRMAMESSGESICDLYYESSPTKRRRKDRSARRQYRVRRIDQAWDVALECLSWERDVCSLRRTVVPSSDLVRLQSDGVDKSWPGKWFRKKLVKHSLAPWLETHCDSTVWKCDPMDGEIRLTVDRNCQANFMTADHPRSPASALNASFVRMNFAVSLPSLFKSLIYEFALLPERPTIVLKLAKQAAKQVGAKRLPIVPAASSITSSGALIREVATCRLG